VNSLFKFFLLQNIVIYSRVLNISDETAKQARSKAYRITNIHSFV